MKSISATFLLLILLTLLSTGSSTAFASVLQPLHPNSARGSDPNMVWDQFEWDGINLFNGNLRVTLPLGIDYPLTQSFSYRLVLNYNSNVWSMAEATSNVVSASPNSFCNAGLGWDLSLGRLLDPLAPDNGSGMWIYISPDGAAHAFFSKLHNDDSTEPIATVAYTRNSTYYRLKKLNATTCIVESPSGIVSTFTLFTDYEWKLTKISDRFSNHLSIRYGIDDWTLTDNHGRTHTVHFRSISSGYYSKVVDRVVLSAFGGVTATYTFEYLMQYVNLPALDNDPTTPTSISIALLMGISAPDGSKHNFAYQAGNGEGRLTSMKLPTLGRIDWTYQTYSFVNPGCPTSLGPALRQNFGVASRVIVNPDGAVAGTYTYTPSLPRTSELSCEEAIEARNMVTTPLGHKTVYYFSVSTKGNGADYALPVSKSLPGVGEGRYLSRQYFDCNSDGTNCVLVRSVYARYEQDTLAPGSPDFGNSNRRLAAQRILYHDDVEAGIERFADTNGTDFDGVGHYRRILTNGNFGSGDVRETVINYSAAVGNYPSPGFTIPGPNQAWLLNLYTQVRHVEGNSRSVVDVCFDKQTGFLKRKRLRYDAYAPSSKDVVITYTPDALGEVGREQYYGGDVQQIDNGLLCNFTLPNDQYQIRYEYQYGTLRRSSYYDESGQPFGSQLADSAIDYHTGIIEMSKNSAGLTTNYLYDTMGRLTWVKPESGHGAWTEYRYFIATPASGAKIAAYQYKNNSQDLLTEDRTVYDGFGRITVITERMPNGAYPNRYLHYNTMGWLTAESEFSTDLPKYRSFLNYDPFGRARIIRPPDGAHHDIVYEYAGVRSVSKTSRAGVSYTPSTGQVREEPRLTSEVFDRQGRLWKEIAHHSSGDNETVHYYDVAGRELEIRADGNRVGALYSYDGRGFLRQTISGSEIIHHESTDAIGRSRLTRRTNGTNNVYLVYDYDRAGRLSVVRDRDNAAKIWKEFVYADSNEPKDWRAGKLWKTVRYNDMSRFLPSVGVADVSETYTYGGVGGRLSEYTIKLHDLLGRHERFSQTYTYTELGDVAQIGYPSTSNSPYNTGVTIPRERMITNTYSWRRLANVTDSLNRIGASSISYHPNGLVRSVVHSNGVTDWTTSDPNGLLRFGSVYTIGAINAIGGPANLNSGDFQYDGSGTIVRAGSQYFVPIEGTPPVGPPPPPPNDPGYPGVCAVGWKDPVGMVYAGVDDQCEAKFFYYYTAQDRLFKFENLTEGEKTWFFVDLGGRRLTEHVYHNSSSPWPGQWSYTRDYVYRGKILLGIDEKLWQVPHLKALHYHIGYAIAGITTDENRRRNDN